MASNTESTTSRHGRSTPGGPDRVIPGHGALLESDGVRFSLWAPRAKQVELLLDSGEVIPMIEGGGYFQQFVPSLEAGRTYRYRMDGGDPLPDPASRFQPEGVHGPSQVVDPFSFRWKDAAWPGVAQKDLVFYELHVGTFTPAGTFRGVQAQLDYLKDLGVTAIELMPVADFPGRWNWGYDPAAFFAPSRAYGAPDELRALVDAAHRTGLAIFLDVIYNHFGPDGAYAASFAPFYTEKHHTPWGAGINLDDEHSRGARDFFIDNALHWLGEYHFDGLRLDAVHALKDDSTPHFLAELSAAVDTLPGPERYLIAEDNRNLRTLLLPRSEGGYEMDGVWSDDFHHQIRNMIAGDADGYYADFSDTTAADIAKTVAQGWFYSGQVGRESGEVRGSDPSGLPLERFVFCIQNHDQVGNRAHGDRLHHHVPTTAYRAASTLLLVVPQLPLLFMGQEWATSSPFQFFTDHHAELGVLVSEGRKNEFEGIAAATEEVPDPQDGDTFLRSRLQWDEQKEWPHQGIRNLYRDLLALRCQLEGKPEIEVHGPRALTLRRGAHSVVVALDEDLSVPLPDAAGELVLHTEQPEYAQHGRAPQIAGGQVQFPVPGAAIFVASS